MVMPRISILAPGGWQAAVASGRVRSAEGPQGGHEITLGHEHLGGHNQVGKREPLRPRRVLVGLEISVAAKAVVLEVWRVDLVRDLEVPLAEDLVEDPHGNSLVALLARELRRRRR
jgi:hypothetical protein